MEAGYFHANLSSFETEAGGTLDVRGKTAHNDHSIGKSSRNHEELTNTINSQLHPSKDPHSQLNPSKSTRKTLRNHFNANTDITSIENSSGGKIPFDCGGDGTSTQSRMFPMEHSIGNVPHGGIPSKVLGSADRQRARMEEDPPRGKRWTSQILVATVSAP